MDARCVELRPAIETLLPLLRARYGSSHEFLFSSSMGAGGVRADPVQIERILLNLCTNAAEAIETRGRIELEVRAAGEQEAQGPGWIVLEVRDNGIGMSEHVKAHLYEPYFTTKSNGTGVGLASVYSTVRQLGGRVSIDSELGRGTRVMLVLPAWV
jgi:signal transduction histidine kinase